MPGSIRQRLPAVVTAAIVACAIVAVLQERGASAPTVAGGSSEVERAYRERSVDVWIEVEGRVSRLLADDNQGARHQRFIIEIDGGRTLLVSHNIDLAPRVPLDLDDRVSVRGEYVWNERGGLLHWTHHDPRGHRAGGWIAHRGQTYR